MSVQNFGCMPAGRRSRRSGSAGNESETAKPSSQVKRTGSTGRVAAARDRLVRSMLSPLNVVVVSRKAIDELFDDAVHRGRMTRSDAQEMAQSLVSRGARATDDFLADLERLLGNRVDALEPADDAGDGAGAANLPIEGYDELSASQVQEQLEGLTPAELRKLRDYEQRHANRKTVLDRIERRLR
jgi:polyhydroxyalkanoate synthesis regulator phasin